MSSHIDDNLITRREFTVESILALLAGVTITVTGCGGSDSPRSPMSPSPTTSGDVTGTISANHGHVATVTAARLQRVERSCSPSKDSQPSAHG